MLVLRLAGVFLWWIFLVAATMIVQTPFEDVPLWKLTLVTGVLGCAALPLMFWREIKEWRARRTAIPAPEVQEEDTPLIPEDEEAVKRNPGNGWRMVRLIMKASTVDKVEALYRDFMSQPHRTSVIDVFAASWLKKARLLDSNHETEKHLWWDFAREAEKLGFADEADATVSRLEKEFPGS